MTFQVSNVAPRMASPFDEAPPIDLVHLSRQTLGDRQLETELLGLFAKQAVSIVKALIKSTEAGRTGCGTAADLLHTLCGSARAVGAWSVAAQAHTLETGLRAQASGAVAEAELGQLAELERTVDMACAAIDDLLDEVAC